MKRHHQVICGLIPGSAAACALLVAQAGAQCLVTKLTLPVPQVADLFGAGLDMKGDRLLVGAYNESTTVSTGGAVHVFRRDDRGTPLDPSDDAWIEEAKLVPTPAKAAAWFGTAVAFDGDRAVVEAFAEGPGTVYIFRLDRRGTPDDPTDDAWIQEARLVPPPGGPFNMAFGGSLSIDGDYVLIGAPQDNPFGDISGSAFIYRRDDAGTPHDPADDTWVLQAKLLASNGKPLNRFGGTVSLSGDHALVGAFGADSPLGPRTGAAYVFVRLDNGTPLDPTDDSWLQQQLLFPYDATQSEEFGDSVALEGDNALVGAPRDDTAAPNAGAVYGFFRDDGGTPAIPGDDTWLPTPKVVAHDGQELNLFGTNVAIHGHEALIRSQVHGSVTKDDTIYVVRRDDGGTPLIPGDDSWTTLGQVTVSLTGNIASDAIAFDGDEALVGVSADSSVVPLGGSASLFAIEQAPWSWIDQSLPGSAGQPCLFATGSLAPGAPLRLALHHALPNATTYLIAGASTLDLPFKGGTLIPSPDRLLVATTDGDGELAVRTNWPPGLPAGVSFTFQAWIADPAGAVGFAATNAVAATSP